MNDNKMIRSAKNLDILANVIGKITVILGGVCLILALFTFIFGGEAYTEGAITLDIDFIKLHLRDNSYVNEKYIKSYVFTITFIAGIICFLIYYISKLFRNILSPMKIGRPFEDGISSNFKKIGWIVLFTGILIEISGIISRLLLIKAYSIEKLFESPNITKTEFVFSINFDFIIITCIIFFLSYIFKYGQALQQDSDETL